MSSSSTSTFLRQLSGRETWESTSKRWVLNQMESLNNIYGSGNVNGNDNENNNGFENGSYGLVLRKKVMVLVDQTSYSKQAMMWALTHVTNKGDLLTLLHVVPSDSPSNSYLANSLGSLCKACKPEVEVDILVIQGPKLATVISQLKKLQVSVLVLGQKKPSSLIKWFCGISSSEDFVEKCIENMDCLTIGVRKQSKGMGGYLISTKWQKNFWLLA